MPSIPNVKNIMLAEDDDDDTAIFREGLAEVDENVHLSIASNGIALMALLNQAVVLPDLIFLDVNMPLKNGFQCLHEIKKNDKWKGIKIIIHSTSSYPEQINRAYNGGADLYLLKSTSYSGFKKSLEECLTCEWALLKKAAN